MRYTLLALMLSVSLMGHAQKKFSVTITVPHYLQKDKIHITYDDGKSMKTAHFDANSDSLVIKGTYYSLYCPIQINYPYNEESPNSYSGVFYIQQKPARISFVDKDSVARLGGKVKLQNAVNADDLGINQMKAYTKKEWTDFHDYYEANKAHLSANDSTLIKVQAKALAGQQKSLEFIKNNGNLYYSFWQFRIGYSSTEFISADSLMHIFQYSFPAKFKNSFEGKEILKILKDRLALNTNNAAPDFNETDINGNKVTLSQFRGKYVVVAFWAPWCVPCIKEITVLTKKTAHIPKDKLQIIYITEDTDTAKFSAAKKKYNMDGIHIFGTGNIIKSYSADAIPQLYLIDKDGKVIYNKDLANEDEHLDVLNSLLQKYITETPINTP